MKKPKIEELRQCFLSEQEWIAAEMALIDGFMPFIGWLPDLDKPIWTTKDGEEINVKDMTDEHILNCMRILKSTPYGKWWIDVFARELYTRSL